MRTYAYNLTIDDGTISEFAIVMKRTRVKNVTYKSTFKYNLLKTSKFFLLKCLTDFLPDEFLAFNFLKSHYLRQQQTATMTTTMSSVPVTTAITMSRICAALDGRLICLPAKQTEGY